MSDGNINLKPLSWTGERYLPNVHGSVELEHFHRYLFAGQVTAGKHVLDVASGEGYGSAMLARAAAHVTGVDISPEAIFHAREKYKASNLEFIESSCAAIPLSDACIDVVVSFETIEHHSEHEAMMLEIKRVLKPDGLLVISCPDKLEYSDKPAYRNEYHVKELYRNEFVQLLESHFTNHIVFGQRAAYGSLILQEDEACLSETYRLAANDMAATPGLSNAIYLIAIATDGAVPPVKVGLLDQDLLSIDEIAERDGQIENLTQTVASLVIDRDSQKTGLAQLQDAFTQLTQERDEQVLQLNGVVAERDGQIENLTQTVESLVIDRDSQKEGLAQLQEAFTQLSQERNEQVLQLDHVVAERDGQIENLTQAVKSHDIDRASQKAELDQLQEAFTQLSQERNEQVLQLNDVVAERDGQIENLTQSVESHDIDRASQKAELDQLQEAFAQLTQERDEQVLRLNDVVAERDGQIENMNMELSALYNSKSWRLTFPLRKLVWWGVKVITFPSRGRQNLQIPVSTTVSLPDVPCGVLEDEKVTANGNTFHILLVSHYCPTRAHAGGLRILDIYALIRKQCPSVQLDLLTHVRPTIDWSHDEIYRIFDNVYLSPVEDLTPATLVSLRGGHLTYDVVDLQFHQSGHHIDAFRHIGEKILFTPMESQAKVLYLDFRTDFDMKSFLPLRKFAASIRMAAEEIVLIQKADKVVCVSRSDAAFLRTFTSSRHICGIDTGVSQFEFEEALAPDYETAKAASKTVSILYVAYFGSETNVLALLWYLEHVHPLIKARVPGYMLTVVGRGDLSPFSKFCDKSIDFVGEVPALAPHIKVARVGIAPALGGSGFRGKVNQYSVLGCPCVVSPIAFKGLSYQDGVSIFVAESPEVFADRCIQLLTDLELNDRMGKAARQLCMARYSWSSKWAAIRKIYKLEGVE